MKISKFVSVIALMFVVAGCDQQKTAGATTSSPSNHFDSKTATTAERPQVTPLPAPTQVSRVGRYTIIHSPHVERDTILLDTETGRTWQLIEGADGLEWQGMVIKGTSEEPPKPSDNQ